MPVRSPLTPGPVGEYFSNECKLCFPKCPYVPPHEFAVDFPRLKSRAKIVRTEEEGVGFRERFLGATDFPGKLMTRVAPVANAMVHNRFNRMLMESTVGVQQDRRLPNYARPLCPDCR